ncbi:MAG: AbrB/MazE/SpoVT family DNA-binding domain-containing protein [Defluviitaleaceae bacterium]|nr:AbrB/MazE/SpoVT family DNA-binding domain-containing protein [Defluviitaleaceae bacterium]
MNLARISTNGQITIPAEIRRALKLSAGDKLMFVCNKKGELVVQKINATLFAPREVDVPLTGTDR